MNFRFLALFLSLTTRAAVLNSNLMDSQDIDYDDFVIEVPMRSSFNPLEMLNEGDRKDLTGMSF